MYSSKHKWRFGVGLFTVTILVSAVACVCYFLKAGGRAQDTTGGGVSCEALPAGFVCGNVSNGLTSGICDCWLADTLADITFMGCTLEYSPYLDIIDVSGSYSIEPLSDEPGVCTIRALVCDSESEVVDFCFDGQPRDMLVSNLTPLANWSCMALDFWEEEPYICDPSCTIGDICDQMDNGGRV